MNRLLNQKQLFTLFESHAKELMREPAVLFWGIVFPLLMALGLGIAFTQSKDIVHNVAVIKIYSSEKSAGGKLDAFLKNRTQKMGNTKDDVDKYELSIKDEKLGNTTYIFQLIDWKRAIVLLKRGEISLVLEEKDDEIEYHFDPVSPDAQLTYLNLSGIINNAFAGDSRKRTNNDFIKNKVEPLTLKGTRYIDFLIPGLMAMGIMMSSIWGLSYGLIEKRSKKLLRRMIATPMRKSHFLISLMTVRTIMNFIEAGLLFLFSYFVFGITIQGSIPALILIFIAGNIGFAGIAIFTSSKTANTEVGNGVISALTTPMIVLSGVFFSYYNFPDWAVSFIRILPLTLVADGMRSIFIEGAGFQEIAAPFLILLAMGILFFSIGLKMFKWH
jgi:ABC-type multidrug transport system permease subunit